MVYFFKAICSLTLLPETLLKDLYDFILFVCLKAMSVIRLIVDRSPKERHLHISLSLSNGLCSIKSFSSVIAVMEIFTENCIVLSYYRCRNLNVKGLFFQS